MDMIPSLERLIEQFRHLPSIGRKTAIRMAFSVLEYSDEEANALVEAIRDAKSNISECPICANIAEGGLCEICADGERDHSLICVVEDYKAVMAMERTREYRGTYHVLHGVLSPLDGIGPEQLKIGELCGRVDEGGVNEIIIATDPDVEGEATASYIAALFTPRGIKVSRLAYGMPVGGDLEYADESTIARALSGRREI